MTNTNSNKEGGRIDSSSTDKKTGTDKSEQVKPDKRLNDQPGSNVEANQTTGGGEDGNWKLAPGGGEQNVLESGNSVP